MSVNHGWMHENQMLFEYALLATAVVLKVWSYPMYHAWDIPALMEDVDLSTMSIWLAGTHNLK